MIHSSISLLLLFLTFFAAPTISAQQLQQAGSELASYKGASSLLSHTFPTKRIKKGRTDLKVIPAFLKFEDGEKTNAGNGGDDGYQSMDGLGYAFGLTRGLSDQWGLSFLGIGFSMEGEGTTTANSTGRWGSNDADGFITALTVIYDPFEGGETDFHMPIIFGAGYTTMEETSKLEENGSSISTSREIKSPILILGLMAQWTWKNWQLSPFIIAGESLDDVSDTCTATGANASCPTTLSPISTGTTAGGVEINYRPWNFGTQILAPIGGVTSYSLKWEYSFGKK